MNGTIVTFLGGALVLNGSGILRGTNVYGPRWLVPTTIVEGRLIQFGANITF
jgi:hypothetical protein